MDIFLMKTSNYHDAIVNFTLYEGTVRSVTHYQAETSV